MRWFLGIVALLGLALALQAGLVAFAGYVLLGVFLLSRYLAKAWIVDIEAERFVATHPREIGETADVRVVVRNKGKIRIAWLLAEDMIPESAALQRRLSLKGARLKVLAIRVDGEDEIKYKLTFHIRGYYQIGPLFVETGDVFGLHRRHRVLTEPEFILVYPKVLPITKFDFSSTRPIGEIRLANRLFEDPTRTAGVRPYQMGDPLQRIHWRATARTGQLHSRVYEPTSLAGATILIDFHSAGYFKNGEPIRSELAITAAMSIANAVTVLNQQIGVASNGRDATDRIREEALTKPEAKPDDEGFASRYDARARFEEKEQSDRLRPVVVETRRGFDQFQQIREMLARLELTDGRTFAEFAIEMGQRMPRDATVIAILPRVPVETSVALGQLKRQGFAVSAVLIGLADDGSDTRAVAAGRLIAEGIRDVRYVNAESDIMGLGDRNAVPSPAEYGVNVELA
ncbi:MAG: DUF58 domain-containing protein [Gemmataceae bacterium]|nr:DUF58 domain-containing protein [Gemmataceae bacterium]